MNKRTFRTAIAALALALLSAPGLAQSRVDVPARGGAIEMVEAGTSIGKTSEATFATDVLSFDGVVVVEVYTDWCGPCKYYAPIIEAVSKSYAGNSRVKFVKVDGDGSPALMQKLGVKGYPLTLFFAKDATGAWRFGSQSGVLDEAKLKAIIDRVAAGTLALPATY